MSPSLDPRFRRELSPEVDSSSIASLLSLLESAPALLWEADSELRFTFLSGAALRAIGISAGSFKGRSIRNLFSPATDAGKALLAHDRALLGYVGSFEVELNGRDLRATVKPLVGPSGAVIGVVGIALDMTERIVAERALRSSEYSYRSLIEEAPY